MLDYIRLLLTLIFAISMMYILLDCEIKQKKKLYILVSYIVIVVICDVLVLLTIGYAHFMRLYPLLVQTAVFLAFVFISRFNIIKVFFVHLTAVAYTNSFSLIGLIVSYFLGFNESIESIKSTINTVSLILYLPAWLIVFRYLRPSFLYMMHNTDKGWLGFSTIPLSFTALIYFTTKYNLDNAISVNFFTYVVLAFTMAIATYFLILRYFKQTREQLTLQNEQNLLRTQVAAAQVHLEALKESQEKTILYRHDMRHHLNLINAYLADNNKAAAEKYITDVEKTIVDVVVEKYCSNYTVNLILSSYIAKARSEQITVVTQIDLPEKNAISDMDLCIIFANAIENAIHACKRINSTNSRTIKITCKTKNDQLFIQISNSYEGTVMFVNEMPVSMEKNHGLGTKSIAAIVQKYGGIYSFSAKEGYFNTSIILQ